MTHLHHNPHMTTPSTLAQTAQPQVLTEFWRVLTGQAPGRVFETQITLFDSEGFALEDYSALRTMQQLGRRAGLLSATELVPTLPDPKDLLAQLLPASGAERIPLKKVA